jgi:hypothetical protein
MDTLTLVPILIIVISPILSQASFILLKNPLIRLLALVSILLAIRRDPMFGLLTLLAVFSLFVERNHFILTNLPGIPSTHVPADSPGKPIKATPHTPIPLVESSHTDSPLDKESEFESAEDLSDNNPNLHEGPSTEEAPVFFESRGLA